MRCRQGYGRCLNGAERMTDALDGAATPTASFRFLIEDIEGAPPSLAAAAPFSGPPLSVRRLSALNIVDAVLESSRTERWVDVRYSADYGSGYL
jgi:hypothetical protein